MMPRMIGTAAARCSLAFLHSFLFLSIPGRHFLDPGAKLLHLIPGGLLRSHVTFVSTTDGALVLPFIGFGVGLGGFCGLASLFILPENTISVLRTWCDII